MVSVICFCFCFFALNALNWFWILNVQRHTCRGDRRFDIFRYDNCVSTVHFSIRMLDEGEVFARREQVFECYYSCRQYSLSNRTHTCPLSFIHIFRKTGNARECRRMFNCGILKSPFTHNDTNDRFSQSKRMCWMFSTRRFFTRSAVARIHIRRARYVSSRPTDMTY